MLKLLSLNVRGLRNGNKRRAIFSYLKKSKSYNLLFARNLLITRRWKIVVYRMGRQYNLFARNHTLKRSLHSFKSQLTFQLSTIKVDPEGRFLIAKLTIEEKYFFITNIYGPNNGCVLEYLYTKERNINELRHNAMYRYENNRNSPVYRYTRTAPK